MFTPVEIRRVTELPTDQVVELYQEFGWWKESVANRQSIPKLIKGSFCFYAAFDGDRLVGMGRVLSDGVSDGLIHDVIVRSEYRGRGIGRELVRRLTQHCRDKKLEWIALIAAPETEGFYQELGFRALHNHHAMLLDLE